MTFCYIERLMGGNSLKNEDFRRRWFGAGVLIALAFATPLHAGGTSPLKQTKAAKQALWITDAFGFTELEGDQILIAFGGAN